MTAPSKMLTMLYDATIAWTDGRIGRPWLTSKCVPFVAQLPVVIGRPVTPTGRRRPAVVVVVCLFALLLIRRIVEAIRSFPEVVRRRAVARQNLKLTFDDVRPSGSQSVTGAHCLMLLSICGQIHYAPPSSHH